MIPHLHGFTDILSLIAAMLIAPALLTFPCRMPSSIG